MRIQNLQAELAKVERRRAKLEQQILSQSTALYTSLPRKVGLKNVDDLVVALLPFTSPSIRKKLQNGAAGPAKASPADTAPVRKSARKNSTPQGDKRTRYSDEQKKAVQQDLKDGKLTMNAISEKRGVRVESIKNWKKQWGLTKSRKKK